MAKREIEEINASSMADIAFLLLVFFLVTSTFLKEKVQDERLPQKTDQEGVKLKPYNVLTILANKNDLILVEDDIYINQGSEVEEIAELVKKFYVHPASESEDKWPKVSLITQKQCEDSVASNAAKSALAPDNLNYSMELKKWEKRLSACEVLGGSYSEISEKAVIGITLDNSTKYETYIKVLDGILSGLTDLRNELCQQKFQRDYTDLDEDIEEEKKIMDAIEMVYPKRIFKAKGIAGTE
jgi:biopolymer transport protein ExbD